MENWVTTKDAERILGIKRDTLKRSYANPNTGFLVENIHWRSGMFRNSSKYWEINRCKETLLEQGFVFTNRA